MGIIIVWLQSGYIHFIGLERVDKSTDQSERDRPLCRLYKNFESSSGDHDINDKDDE